MRPRMRTYRMLSAMAAIALLGAALVACGDADDQDEAPAPAATAAPVLATPFAVRGTPTPIPTQAAAAATPTAAPAAPRAAPTGEPTPAPAAQQPGPADTTFRNYGRTPFVDSATDAVSTFSLDTDRSSYFLALNWAQNGGYNAFAYGWSQLRLGAGGGVDQRLRAYAGYDQPRDASIAVVHFSSFAIMTAPLATWSDTR